MRIFRVTRDTHLYWNPEGNIGGNDYPIFREHLFVPEGTLVRERSSPRGSKFGRRSASGLASPGWTRLSTVVGPGERSGWIVEGDLNELIG